VVCVSIATLLWTACGGGGDAPIVGVSWSNFQEERWRVDEAALAAELERQGAIYVSADAQSSTEKQLADIESLIARGANALVIVAQDADAIRPAIALASAEGIPVIGYDRLIELPGVFYISFDNVEVGRIQAREILKRVPGGSRIVFIKGSAQDPNANFVHGGQLEILRDAIERGDLVVVGDQYVDGWLPETAQRVMEQILTANENRVDAVVCSNDGMAGGVLAALMAQGLEGLPLSGQDGDHAALNRVARGLQTVSVWKDARALGREAARVALELAAGRSVEGTRTWTHGPRGTAVDAILLEPIAITRQNLSLVIDAGWAPRESVCRGVGEAPPPACAGS
jgi:D-xylose transport system substrate-binding protein